MRHLTENDVKGILWAISACFFVSIMVGIVRKVSEDLHVTQILMMRCFFSVILLAPIIIKTNGKVFYTKKFGLHFLRATSGFIAMLSWFYVVTQIPLPEAVSITFIVPIITTIAAIFILGEEVSSKLWLSLILGFIGVIIIIRPGFQEVSFAHFLSLISTVLWAVSNILTKKLSKTDKPKTVVLYIAILIFIMSVPVSAPYLKMMDFEQLFWLFLLGLSANLAHFSLSISYEKTDISIVQPFDFSRLIFISIIAYFAFEELVDIYMIIGSIIIIFSCVYLSSSRKKKEIK